MDIPQGDTTAAWLASTRAALDELERAATRESRLVAAAQVARYADRLVSGLVDEARTGEQPVSWARIGSALGMTRQAANERFGDAARQGAQIRRYRRARRLERLRAQEAQTATGGRNQR
jgi:biotin operon repressor